MVLNSSQIYKYIPVSQELKKYLVDWPTHVFLVFIAKKKKNSFAYRLLRRGKKII